MPFLLVVNSSSGSGGGDGTVTAVAQHIAGTDGVLGVLPAGTLNHFARDPGREDPVRALDALAGGRVARAGWT